MNLLGPVSNIMSTDLITVGKNDPIKKVEELFENHKIHHLPVTDQDDLLVGMVSRSDYLLFKRGFNQFEQSDRYDLFRLKTNKVESIMTTGIAKLEPDDKVNVALEIFRENLFHAIPIVKDGKLRGIVTTLDIIEHLARDESVVKKYEML